MIQKTAHLQAEQAHRAPHAAQGRSTPSSSEREGPRRPRGIAESASLIDCATDATRCSEALEGWPGAAARKDTEGPTRAGERTAAGFGGVLSSNEGGTSVVLS
jgi:hypothetical protein